MLDRVLSTTDYSIFELDYMNREVKIGSKKFKNLLESMRKYGHKSSHPLDVVKNGNGKLKVRCGHNRLTAAKLLGIPVKYVISYDEATINELESAGPGGWKPEDYLDSYTKRGFENYITLKEYIKETGIGMSNAASMFFGESAGSGNYMKHDRFQGGKFTIKDTKHPSDVKDVVLFLRGEPVSIKWANSNLFVRALSRVLKLEEFSKQRFIEKATTFPQLFRKQKSLEDYLRHIEDIYNYKVVHSDRVNVAFLAEKAAMERFRSVFKSKNK